MMGKHGQKILAALLVAAVACGGGGHADEAVGKESAVAVLAYMKASNAKDADKLKSFYAEDVQTEYVNYLPPTKVQGRDKLVDGTFRESWKAFPDAQFDPVRVLIKGREVVLISLATGTNTGSIQGLPPTEEPIGILSGYHWTLNDAGKIATEVVYTDQSALPGQLGLLPEGAEFRRAEASTGNSPKIVVAKNNDTERANAELIKDMNKAFNKHDAAATLAFYSDSAVYSYVPAPKDRKGRKSIGKTIEQSFAMSSDIQAKIDWVWGAESYVTARIITSGTNDGEIAGSEATNKPFEQLELHVYKIKKTKITRQWIFANDMSLAVQLGLAQSPE